MVLTGDLCRVVAIRESRSERWIYTVEWDRMNVDLREGLLGLS
jgi:hypothetical protein